MNIERKNGFKKTVLWLIIAAISAVVVLAFLSAPIYSDDTAAADAVSVTPINLRPVTDLSAATPTYNKYPLKFASSASSVGGNYYTSEDFYSLKTNAFSAGTLIGAGGYRWGDQNNYQDVLPSAAWYCDIRVGDNLECAVLDPFTEVKIALCATLTDDNVQDGGAETADIKIAFYNGVGDVEQYTATEFKNVKLSNVDNKNFRCEATIKSDLTWKINKNAFIRVSFDNWQCDYSFGIAWTEMYLETTVSMTEASKPVLKQESAAVYDPSGWRMAEKFYGAEEASDFELLVKPGNIVALKYSMEVAGNSVSAPTSREFTTTGNETSKELAGRYFAKIYQSSAGADDTFIKFEVNGSSYASRIFSYDFPASFVAETEEYFAGGDGFTLSDDISGDYSGLIAYFKVTEESFSGNSFRIRATVWRGDNISTGITADTTVNYDCNAPLQPSPDVNSAFYKKYVSGSSYYTDDEACIKTEVSPGETEITAVDMTRGALKFQFASSVFDGEKEFYIYYKTLRVNSIPRNGESSRGFGLSEGRLYAKYDSYDGGLKISDFLFDMTSKNEEGRTVYNKSGFYSIEFMAVDEAGNYSYYSKKIFVKVDVKDYAFSCGLVVGTSGSTADIINMSDAQPSFATIKDDGTVTGFVNYDGDRATFKRGSKVLVRVSMSSAGRNEYILTGFNTGDYAQNDTSGITNDPQSNSLYYVNRYSYNAIFYAFEVDSSFVDTTDERGYDGKMFLTFKKRAYITVKNLVQTYTGGGLKVIPVVKDGTGSDAKTIDCNVRTYYKINGVYVETLPVEKGVYPVKCELKDHRTYYATTEWDNVEYNLTINAAEPVIDKSKLVAEEINYGDSLSAIDFREITDAEISQGKVQSFNTGIKYVTDGQFFYDRSADGIIGYYSLDFADKNSAEYTRHGAGTFDVKVIFTPIKSRDGKPAYNGGRFVRNENYLTVTVTIKVTVRHSEAVTLEVNGLENEILTFVYDEKTKFIDFDVFSEIETDGSGKLSLYNFADVTYGDFDGTEGSFVSTPPADAGKYTVRITLVNKGGNKCNYKGSWEFKMIIEKLKLDVVADDVKCDFQFETAPVPVASYGLGADKVEYFRLKYDFTYYVYDGGNYDEAASGEGTNVLPTDAGKYLVRMEIRETNFENSANAYCMLTIDKVSSDSDRFAANSIDMPSIDGSLFYMQPLLAADFIINSTTGVRYPYRNGAAYEFRPVEGYFMLSYREFRSAGHENETVEEFVFENNRYVFDDIGSYDVYVCFIASGKDEGNFYPICRAASVYVEAAVPDATEITVDNITYLQKADLENLSPKGNLRFKILPYDRVPADGSLTEYLSVDKDDPALGYRFEAVNPAAVFDVGIHEIALKTVFTGTASEKLVPTVFTVTFSVEKYELTVTLAENEAFNPETGAYEYKYGAVEVPPVNYDAEAEAGYEITYYSGIDIVPFDGLTVGSYRAVCKITDKNFSGEAEYAVTVKKADLASSALPDVFVGGANTVAYNRLMSDTAFTSGVMKARYNGETVTVSGTYEFDYPAGTRFTSTGVAEYYNLRFTADNPNYNVYTAAVDPNFRLRLTVAKEDLGSRMKVTVNGNYVYGELKKGFDISTVASCDTAVYLNANGEYSEVMADGYFNLNGSFDINAGNYEIIPAGDYSVTYTIDDPNYKGVASAVLTVEKKLAVITVAESDKTVDFNNMSRTVKYTLTSDGEPITETVVQNFYNNGAAMGAPTLIGKYEAVLSLRSNNYYAEPVRVDFTIRVDKGLISVGNTDQVYESPRQVSVVLRLIEAVYTIEFADKKSDNAELDLADPTVKRYSDLPVNAGEYWIILYFEAADNNGYEEVIICDKNLVIERRTATITVSDTVTVSYTGASNPIRITTMPYGLSYTVEYRRENEDEYSFEEVLDANVSGSHYIRITIDEPNYCGEKIVIYRINPAVPTEESAPTFGDYVYNSETSPALISEGLVYFRGTLVYGSYEIKLSEINALTVGRHRVNYVFTALKDGLPDVNFSPCYGTTEINVIKREISADDIILGENSGFYAEYNGNAFDVDAYVKDGVIFNPSANSDLTVKIFYNGQTERPKEPGEYTVRAEISSINYSGSKNGQKFIVAKGIPVITSYPVPVDNTEFNIGDVFTAAHLKEGTGYAVVNGTERQIKGDFVAQEKTFNKANLNDVTVVFIPYDSAHFEAAAFTIKVNVKGQDPFIADDYGDWNGEIVTDKGAVTISARYDGSAVYGVNAGSFRLVVSGNAEATAYFNSFGILSVSDPNAIPDVGGKIEVTFVPIGSLADTYNIMHGYVSVDIEKADSKGTEVTFVAYANKTFAEGKILVTKDGKEIPADGQLYIFDENGSAVDMNSYPEAKKYSYRYVTNNYTDLTGEFDVVLKIRVDEKNIVAENAEKSYDGKKISAEDISVKVINTDSVFDPEHITVTAYIDGKETDSFETGTYTVIIRVDNGIYFGEKTMEFTITRRNVSSVMELKENSKEYGKAFTPVLIVDGSIWEGSFTVFYKAYGASDAFYAQNVPENAGKYIAKVTLDEENCYGETTFEFTVTPKRLVLVSDASYVYDYGKTMSPENISFREPDSVTPVSIDYGVYYYSSTLSMGNKNVLPVNAGRYTGRVVPDDPNYSLGENGYAEFTYIINKLSVTVNTVPTAYMHVEGETSYNLKYGQTAGELALTGGQAKYNDEPVAGIFRVKNSSVIPEVGKFTVTIEFIPGDANYSSAECNLDITVAPADVTVIFDNLQTSYKGISVSNEIAYRVLPSGVRIRLVFYNSYGEAVEPVGAGGYRVEAISLNPNYRVSVALDSSGNNPVFVVAKAAVREVLDPVATPITFGDSLIKSSLTSGDNFGKVFYEGFNNAVSGRFEFVRRSLTFKESGVHDGIEYIFTPTDSANYAEYKGTTSVMVEKALATLKVSGTEFVYSEGFKLPTFTTNPENLIVEHDITFNEYDPTSPDYVYNESDYVDAGTYYFHAWVKDSDDSDYYSEKVRFAITITKKNLDIDFVTVIDGRESTVMQYLTTYGKILSARIKLYPSGTPGKSGYLLKDEYFNGSLISENFETQYKSAESGRSYDSHVPPSDIGVYSVTVTLKNDNYAATRTTIYKIESGVIEAVYFDSATMENQVYGSVVPPIITTSPANVSYYIVYQGSTVMPTSAGSYQITVYFDDPNYEKKQSTAMFKINKKPLTVSGITVNDKSYDGTSSLEISGKLNGIMYGDEVNLRMTAQTEGNNSSVGGHYVEITSYTLLGLQASNYDLEPPVYYNKVYITPSKINAPNSASFITSATGFEEGTTVTFNTVNSSEYKTSFFEAVTGRDSKVIGYTVRVNGADTIIKDTFKVYVAIPEEFLDSEFEVKGIGALQDGIVFTREGDYVTFYASSSGQVVFKKTEFRYEFVVIAAAVVIAIIGIIVLIVLNPMQRRSKVTVSNAEKEAIKRIKRGY